MPRTDVMPSARPELSPSHSENRGSSPEGSASDSNDLAPMGCLFELLWGVFGE